MPQKQRWFWLAALIAAWFCDFLFWKKPIGLSFLLWTVILLGAGYLLAWREQKKPSPFSVVLTFLILGFATVTTWRDESLISGLSVLYTLAGMILLTATFLTGFWPWYRIRDYIVEFARVIGGGFSGAVLLNSNCKPPVMTNIESRPSAIRRFLPVLRGILITLPVLAVMGLLLSTADPVFGDWLKRIFNLEKLPEYLFRLFYILIIAGFLVGVYLRALYPAKPAVKPAPNTPWLKQFLGWTETSILLGAVNLLFVVFVVIQMRYLFGGEVNITETGYTYAEYARRGFGELVAVALLSLGLYYALSTISKRETRTKTVIFSALSVLLLLNVLVILGSSLQRLMLYENAYGFSQLRTRTHIFIFWLAGLILATMVLEIFRRRGHLPLAMLVCVVGFGVTLSVFNTDGFIINRNLQRATAGEEFDIQYLNSLSTDAVPALVNWYQRDDLPLDLKDALGSALACQEKVMEDPAALPWQSLNFSKTAAYKALHLNSSSWSQYKPYQDEYGFWVILYEDKPMECFNYMMQD